MAARAGTAASEGYTCSFETDPPDDIPTECPVCLLVLREPFQLTCCGKAFCESCIKKVLKDKNVCPACNSSGPRSFIDKRLKQALHGRRVICREGSGSSVCGWVGQLSQLDTHLNLDTAPELDGCQFAKIKCEFCNNLYQRRHLKNHQQKDCPKRPFKCKHCGHRDTHDKGVRSHMPVCPKLPKPCPNCYDIFERQNLEHHINKKCHLTPVSCEYRVVGCEAKPVRKDMQNHFREEMRVHVSLLAKHLKMHSHQTSNSLPLVASCLEQLMKKQERDNLQLKYQQRIIVAILVLFMITLLVAGFIL